MGGNSETDKCKMEWVKNAKKKFEMKRYERMDMRERGRGRGGN